MSLLIIPLSEPFNISRFKIEAAAAAVYIAYRLSLVLDQLLLDVLCHLVVEPKLLPLCLEFFGLAVPADVPVEPGGHVVLDELLGVNVKGLQEPRVALQQVLLVVSRTNRIIQGFMIDFLNLCTG